MNEVVVVLELMVEEREEKGELGWRGRLGGEELDGLGEGGTDRVDSGADELIQERVLDGLRLRGHQEGEGEKVV